MDEKIDVHGAAAGHEGRYTNHFQVGFNAFEFVLDFGQAYEDAPGEMRHTRIVTGPAYAKAFAALLLESLHSYEKTYGSIPEVGPGTPARPGEDHA